MAINETVHTRVTADASQAVGEMNRAARGFTAIGDAARKTSGASDDFFSGITGALAKFNLALGGVEKGLGLVKDAIGLAKFADEMRRLEQAVPTATLDALRVASRGLATDIDLLRAANSAMRGDFALSGEEMVTMTRAATVLAAQTLRPLTEVMEILTDATRGKTQALDDLTVNFVKTGDEVKDKIALFQKFNAIIADGKPHDAQAENLQRMTAEWENSINTIKDSLGEMAATILSVLGPAVKFLTDRLAELTGRNGVIRRSAEAHALQTLQDKYGAFTVAGASAVGFTGLGAQINAERDALIREYIEAQSEVDAVQSARVTATGALDFSGEPMVVRRSGSKKTGSSQSLGMDFEPLSVRTSAGDLDALMDKATGVGNVQRVASDEDVAERLAAQKAMNDAQERAIEVNRRFQEALGQTSMVADLMANAMLGVEDAMLASIDAAIFGSESVANAVLKSLAMTLRGIAQSEAVLALRDIAAGFSALAEPGFQGLAPGYFTAAAKHAAAATAAGVGSSMMLSSAGARGGAGASSYGAAGGGYSSPGTRSGAGSGETIIVQVGDGFVGDAHGLAEEIDRKLRAGKRAGIVRDQRGAVTFS